MCTALADRTQKKSSFYEKKPPFRTKKRTCLNVLLMQTTYQKQTLFPAKLRYFQKKSIQKTVARYVYCLGGPHTEKELILREKPPFQIEKRTWLNVLLMQKTYQKQTLFPANFDISRAKTSRSPPTPAAAAALAAASTAA